MFEDGSRYWLRQSILKSFARHSSTPPTVLRVALYLATEDTRSGWVRTSGEGIASWLNARAMSVKHALRAMLATGIVKSRRVPGTRSSFEYTLSRNPNPEDIESCALTYDSFRYPTGKPKPQRLRRSRACTPSEPSRAPCLQSVQAQREHGSAPGIDNGLTTRGESATMGNDMTPSESSSPSARSTRSKRTISSWDRMARDLAKRLGSSLTTCRAQVTALKAAGWGEARIERAIGDYACPGLAPWDWTKKCVGTLGVNQKGMSVQDILRWGREERTTA